MRMLDAERRHSVRVMQLYLTRSDASALRDGLDKLLREPEAGEHDHIISDGRDLSYSIVTDTELKGAGYTELERQILMEK